MSKPSVVVNGLSKKFSISLKNALRYGIIDTARRFIGSGKDKHLRNGEFWALHDINFELQPGDTLGIMGGNGSGKTTLLRILNGSYSPDRGRAMLRGRVGALIAAGAGFSPMLTGRENVFVSAALLGMKPAETRKRFDEIVAFSGLEEFIDMPVRNYSSGMAVRLGFAVAVLGNPDILLVDEVLAVGDISFQKKCYERIHELKRQGTTILLVSHSPGAIWAVCDKGLVLQEGQSSGIIPVEEACKQYEHNNMTEHIKLKKSNQLDEALAKDYQGIMGGTGEAFITKVEVLNEAYKVVSSLPFGNTFILRLHLDIHTEIQEGIIRVSIDSEINKGIAIIDNYETDGKLMSLDPGMHTVDIKISEPQLRPAIYIFNAAIVMKSAGIHLFFIQNCAQLMITHPPDAFFYADFRASIQLNASYVCFK